MRRNPPSSAQVRCWTVPRPEVDSGPPPVQPPRADPMHGYTLDAVDHLARSALRIDRWSNAGDTRERYDAARYAIVEHILAAQAPPSRHDLLGAALRATDLHVRGEIHHRGRSSATVGDGMPRFDMYWAPAPAASPEGNIVERIALAQIMPLLTPAQQRALRALAFFEDYGMAAQACAVTEGTFRVLISTGRRRFLALWHEGETPSKQWRTDRRVYERAAAPGGFDARGRRRLTAFELEALRERYVRGGKTLTALAAEVGVHKATLSALLRGRTKPAHP